MKTYVISILAVTTALTLSACGASSKGSNSGSPSLNTTIDPDQQANLAARPQLSEVESDPSVAAPYACGNDGVLICHFPPGNPNNRHSICIGAAAVPHHIAEHQRDNIGDYLGACEGDGTDGTGTDTGSTGGTTTGTGTDTGTGSQIIDCTNPANLTNPLCG